MGEPCQSLLDKGKVSPPEPQRLQHRQLRGAPQGSLGCSVHSGAPALHVAAGWHPSQLGGAAKSTRLIKKVLAAAGFTRKSEASLEHVEWGWKEERLAAFFLLLKLL